MTGAMVMNRFPGICHCSLHPRGYRVAAGAGVAVRYGEGEAWVVRCTLSEGPTRRCGCGRRAIFSWPTWGDLCDRCCNRAGIIPELWR